MTTRFNILGLSAAAVLAAASSTNAQPVEAERATVEAMAHCLWSKAPASTALWLDSPEANTLEEFSSFEKSRKTRAWYRMFAACNAVLPLNLPVYQQAAFGQHIAATRPSEIGDDAHEIRVFQCLYWRPSDDGEKQYTSGRWGYLSDGELKVIFESSAPYLSSDEQVTVQYTCSYIESDGSLTDA